MTLAITAAFAPDEALPSVLLTVTSTTGGPSPVPVNSRIVITRIHADGTRHQVLTAADPRVIGGAWAGFDVHSPFNQFITFEVAAAGFTALSGDVFVPSSSTWLMHPSDPDRSLRVLSIRSIGDRSAPSRASIFQPMSDPGTPRNPPVSISDGARGALVGSITVKIDIADLPAAQALLGDDSVILINTPGGTAWRIRWMWVQMDVDYINEGNRADWPFELIKGSFREAADPDMSRVSSWTAGEAADYFRSIGVNAGAVKALYANCLAFKTNTRL